MFENTRQTKNNNIIIAVVFGLVWNYLFGRRCRLLFHYLQKIISQKSTVTRKVIFFSNILGIINNNRFEMPVYPFLSYMRSSYNEKYLYTLLLLLLWWNAIERVLAFLSLLSNAQICGAKRQNRETDRRTNKHSGGILSEFYIKVDLIEISIFKIYLCVPEWTLQILVFFLNYIR